MSIRKRYLEELYINNLVYRESCSKEENEQYRKMKPGDLPDSVSRDQNPDTPMFLKYSKSDLTDDELKLFILSKINSNLKIIKGCAIFVAILASIGIILGLAVIDQLSTIH